MATLQTLRIGEPRPARLPPALRILCVNQRYFPYTEYGGTVYKNMQLASHLRAEGHAVAILTADLGELRSRLAAHELRVEHADARTLQLEPGVETVIYLRSVARYRVATINPELLSFCWRHLRRFDVVHIFGLYTLLEPPVAALCRLLGVPYLVEPCGMVQPRERSLLKKKVYMSLAGRALLRGASQVIATSATERAEIRAVLGADHGVIVRRNGIDLPGAEELPARGAAREELGLAVDDKLVVFIGRIATIKGLDLLLEALQRLPAAVKVALYGPDDRDGHLERLRDLAAAPSLKGRVAFRVGFIGGRAKLQVLADADAFVLCSVSENYGNAAAEAAGCGVPVVVTDTCGIAPLLAGRAGLTVPRQAAALAQALRRVLYDQATLSHFDGQRAEVLRSLSWQDPVNQQVALYQQVSKRSPAR